MKTKFVVVLLTLTIFGTAAYGQDSKSQKGRTPAKTEKSSEMSKPSSEPCCPEMQPGSCCGQTDTKSVKLNKTKNETKAVAVVFTCPMHPEIKSDKPGKCPKCGMDLVQKK